MFCINIFLICLLVVVFCTEISEFYIQKYVENFTYTRLHTLVLDNKGGHTMMGDRASFFWEKVDIYFNVFYSISGLKFVRGFVCNCI